MKSIFDKFILLLVLASCRPVQQTSTPGGDDATRTSPSPAPAPAPAPSSTPNPSSPSNPFSTPQNTTGTTSTTASTQPQSCDQLWIQYVANFKVGVVTTYQSSISSSSPLMAYLGSGPQPLTHIETVTASTPDQVTRYVQIQAVNPAIQAAVAQMKLPTTMTVFKANFISACLKANNNVTGTTAFAGGNANVLSSRDETVVAPAGTFNTHYMKIQATVSASGSAIEAIMDVWIDHAIPGLVVKQTADLTNVPVVGEAIINDLLATKVGI